MYENRREIMQDVFLTYLPARKFKTSRLTVNLIAGLDRASASANALLPAVLSRGTARYPDMEQLSAAMDTLYGATVDSIVRKKGERQCIGFAASFIDDAFTPHGEKLLEPVAELLGELLCDPVTERGRFVTAYFEGEKTNLIDAIRSQVNDKREYAYARLLREMCDGEPYGISRLGDEAGAEKLQMPKLHALYGELLATARLELFYCGSASLERVREALAAAFATLPRDGIRDIAPSTPHPARTEVKRVEEAMDVTQGKLGMGFSCGSSDMPALLMGNTLFGGSSNSKLFLNVREKLSLCYYASSSYARSKKILTISSGIEPKDYDRTLEEILHQLRQVQQGQWEPWELEGARSTALNSLRSVGDSQSALENFYMSRAAVDQQETPEELMQSLSAVTPERICAAAQSIRLDTVYFLRGKEAAQ